MGDPAPSAPYYGNVVVENFFDSLKNEIIHHRDYQTATTLGRNIRAH
jgi:hypothetical protein